MHLLFLDESGKPEERTFEVEGVGLKVFPERVRADEPPGGSCSSRE